MLIRLLVIILIFFSVVMGLHYFKYRFDIGPGLPDISGYLPDIASSPEPTPLVETSLPDVPTETIAQQLASLLAVPLLLDESGIASESMSLSYIAETRPSMVVLFGSEISATVAAQVTGELAKLPVPPVVAVDHEGGDVQRLSGAGFTKLPSWQQLCSYSPERRQALIASSAAELQEAGIDVVLGPVVDLVASGSALRTRSCSRDPSVVAAVSQELVSAYKAHGITSMLKHFPGIGSAQADLHTRTAKVTLQPRDTQPFEALLTANQDLPVMVSHLRVDPADPNTPCSMSYLCIGELRRAYPELLVVSDALEMESAGFLASSSALLRTNPERAVATLRAGADIALFGPSVTQEELALVLGKMESELARSNVIENPIQKHIEKVRDWRSFLTQQ